MKTNNLLEFFIKGTLLITITILFVNMGSGVDQQGNITPEPIFIELDEDATSYIATIQDDKKNTKVKDLSFGGKTKISGIRREEDNAVIEIDLENIKTLTIVKKSYYSEKFTGREFVLVNCTSVEGRPINKLLFPRNISLSGLSISPGIKGIRFAWYLKDIEKISIDHDATAAEKEAKITGEKK